MISSWRSNVFLLAVFLFLLVPLFFGGGRELIGILFILIFPAVFLLNKRVWGELAIDNFDLTYLLFLAVAFSFSVWSVNIYQSLLFTFVWLALWLVYKLILKSCLSKKEINLIVETMILVTFVTIIIGTYFFTGVLNSVYPRFFSIFYQHNAYAAFLLLPLSILITRVFWGGLIKYQLLARVILIVTLVVFLLTFSRGAWLSLAGAWFLYFLVAGFGKYFKNISQKTPSNYLIIAAIVLSAGIGYVVVSYWNTFYPGETWGQNAFLNRVDYWRAAWVVFSGNLLTGVGFYSFGDAWSYFRPDVKFFISDPHNVVVRMFAEVGLVGGSIFVWWLIMIFKKIIKVFVFYKEKEYKDWAVIGLAVGILAILLHSLIDIDWQFPAILIFLWVGLALLSSFQDVLSGEESIFRVNAYLVVLVSMVLAVASVVIFMAQVIFKEAITNLDQAKSLEEYRLAIRLDPLNPYYRKEFANALSRVAYVSAPRDLSEALEQYSLVSRLMPLDSENFYLKARANYIKGDYDQEKNDLLKSIEVDSFGSLVAYERLVEINLKDEDYLSIENLLDNLIKAYPGELIEDINWIHPNKEVLRNKLKNLGGILVITYEKLGETQSAEETRLWIASY